MQGVGSGWVVIALSLAGCFQSREPRCGPGLSCTVAGSGDERDFGGAGEPATDARLALPIDVTAAPDGRLYILDWGNHRIRAVVAAGIFETLAGTGEIGAIGDKVADGSAGFNHARDLRLWTDVAHDAEIGDPKINWEQGRGAYALLYMQTVCLGALQSD